MRGLPSLARLRAVADVVRDYAALLYTPVLTAYAVWLTAVVAFGAWTASSEPLRINILGAALILALCLIGLGVLFYQRRPTPRIRARAPVGELEIGASEGCGAERPAPEGEGRGGRGPMG